MTSPYEPEGIRNYSQSLQAEVLLVTEKGSYEGWVCVRHPDGQWVTLREATANDLADFGMIRI